ncbi:cytochrome o ubiquinol oxidase subunit IV [Undibacterium terreum]|uniref:Cytochrome bo(3) ubiquinol oxidase subunit 4 n=1 Tax=Undibacterium terreum TaxID=1224302 RepID=A0A916XRS9_9BURK|nr:cytochrome o ubiquinol oxidase subunit IV [Undibacterium terreum]GGD00345.1 cytochrome o ubiquinol oxidase subunit IV [Undibacterium terreum]
MTDYLSPQEPATEKAPGIRTGGGHGTWHGYLIGYLSAAFLTTAAFILAINDWMTPASILAAVSVLAVAQMLVHLIFFLHINTAPEQRTNILAFAATLLIIFIVVVGSLWIMSHLHHNMMPMNILMKMQR